MFEHKIKEIAYVENDFKEKFGIPRQSGRAPDVISRIIFHPEFRSADALRDIEGFNYLWLIFDFSKAHKKEWSPLVRPPRLGGNKKVGVFASRSPFRPNNIGLSSVKLVRVENTTEYGITLLVSGADLLDKTPIYDIKPYLPFTDCHCDALCGYAQEQQDYKLKVVFLDKTKEQIPENKLSSIIQCLSDDPRPSYQSDGKEYGMRFGNLNIKFYVEKNILTVTEIENV